jgi:hypothetical protein
MVRKEFKTTINAPREKVWEALWQDESYQEWTSVFAAGSKAETDWKKGSKVLFTDGKGSGMVSRIADTIPNEYMSIEHLGFVKDGVEDTSSDEVKKWAGAMENYTLKNVSGKTELVVDMDLTEEYKDYFSETWPKALEKLKEITEKN